MLFMYFRQNSHRYSLGSLQDDRQTVHATIHNQEMNLHEQFMNFAAVSSINNDSLSSVQPQ